MVLFKEHFIKLKLCGNAFQQKEALSKYLFCGIRQTCVQTLL